MKNRTIIGIICIALAVAIMFGVTPFISMLSSETIEAIQLNKNISEGSQITADDIVVVEIGKEGTSENIIINKQDVVGKFATTDLYPEMNLLPVMLTDDASNADTVLKNLDKDHMAISITVPSFAAALSAKLENSDIVSVVVTTPDDTFIPRELTYVRVITTTTSEGIDRDDLDSVEEGGETLPSTITLAVSPMQAALLAEYEVKADMHLALVSRGNPEAAKEYLDTQDGIIQEIIEEQLKELAEQEAQEQEHAPGDIVDSEDGGENNG